MTYTCETDLKKWGLYITHVTRSRTLVNFKETIVHFSHHFQPLLGTRYLTFPPQTLQCWMVYEAYEKRNRIYTVNQHTSAKPIAFQSTPTIRFFFFWILLIQFTMFDPYPPCSQHRRAPMAPWIGANSSRPPKRQRLLVLQHLWGHVWTFSPSSPLLVFNGLD